MNAVVEPMNPQRARLFAILAITCAFTHGLWMSWLTWGDLIIDCGRELDVAKQLLEGKFLYTDLRYWYGPLAPEFNGLLFRIFGVHLNVLYTAGIASAAIGSWLIYRTARLLTTRVPATFATLAFIYLCAFGHTLGNNIYNWVLPYTYAASYGMLLSLGSLFFLLRHVLKNRSRDFYHSVLLFALVGFTKVELLAAMLVLHLCWVMAALKSKRFTFRVHGAGYLLALAIFLLVWDFEYARAGSALFSDNLFLSGQLASHAFFAEVMGTNNIPASLYKLGISSLLLLAVVGLHRGARLITQPGSSSERLSQLFICMLAAWIYCLSPWEMLLRVLPVAALIVSLVFALRWWRNLAQTRLLTLSLLAVFASAALARVFLNAGGYHYGFYLLPAGLIVWALLWFEWLTPLPHASHAPRHAALGVFIGLIFAHAAVSQHYYAFHTVSISGPRGEIRVIDFMLEKPPGSFQQQAVEWLKKQPSNQRVLVLPQGAGLSFISGHHNAYGTFTYLPLDFSGDHGDESTLKTWSRHPPDFVVYVPQSLSEWGSQGFGIDYARTCYGWLEVHFHQAAAFGDEEHLRQTIRIFNPEAVDPK